MFLLRLIRAVVRALFAKRTDLVAENLALRQQLNVLRRKVERPRLTVRRSGLKVLTSRKISDVRVSGHYGFARSPWRQTPRSNETS